MTSQGAIRGCFLCWWGTGELDAVEGKEPGLHPGGVQGGGFGKGVGAADKQMGNAQWRRHSSCCFFFLATPRGLWDLSSMIRD